MEGAKYYDPVNTKGVVLDGKMSDAEKGMDYETHHEWWALTGPEGNFMMRMVLPDKWRGTIPQKLYYVDDMGAEDPPETDPGSRCPGILLDAMVDIPAGSHTFSNYYMVPEEDPPASAPTMLNILDHPLKVKAKPMQ